MMDLNLQGLQALISGGSSGIGLAVARALATEGCGVHLAARNETALKSAASEIRALYDTPVEVYPTDLSEHGAIDALIRACPDVDILVNNAGAIPGGDIAAIDAESWRLGWELKVFGYIDMTRAVYDSMCKRGHGVIVNVIGAAGEVPDAQYVCGSVGNAALMHLTKTLGGRSSEHGVRVVGVNPGLTATDRMVALMRKRAESELGDSERWREMLAHLPFGRPGRPEEVADAVAFLASERAAYISGAVLTVDGGFTKRGRSF